MTNSEFQAHLALTLDEGSERCSVSTPVTVLGQVAVPVEGKWAFAIEFGRAMMAFSFIEQIMC